MSLHYLLDGYNIIHQMPVVNLAKLEDQRTALIHYIATVRPQGSRNNRVTVVFDGQPDVFGSESSGDVRVVFSRHGSADDRIKKMVAESTQRKQLRVVTDDRAIQYAVRALGARALSVQAFLDQAPSSRSGGASGPQTSSKHIPPDTASRINDELEAIWLRKRRKN